MASHAQGFRFHSSHGAGIRLNGTRTTATRVKDEGSIVLSNDPITPGDIYEASNCRIQVGICDWNPDEEVPRSSLPDSAENIPGRMVGMDNGWRKAVVCAVEKGLAFPIGMDGTGCKVTSDNVQWPDELDSKSTIGVRLDKDRRLHLYIGGKDKGVFATGVPDLKWYAFWDL